MKASVRRALRHRRAKIFLMIGVITVEGLIAFYLGFGRSAPATRGYLSKIGREYLVAWHDASVPNFQYATYGSLDEAILFLKGNLGLSTGHTVRPELELENVWVQDRYGSFVVFWKTEKIPFVNQISFPSEREAKFFADAFRKGAYTPSPYGHAIVLKQAEKSGR